jgi:hypothetical protein
MRKKIKYDLKRAFEPMNMTTKLWLSIPVQKVCISDLIFSQTHVSIEGVLNAKAKGSSFCGDSYPHVINYQGKLFLNDGHCRITMKLLNGETHTEVRILNRN